MDPNRIRGEQQVTRLSGPLQNNLWLLLHKFVDFYGYSEDIDTQTIRLLVEEYTNPGAESSGWNPARNALVAICAAAIILINMLARVESAVTVSAGTGRGSDRPTAETLLSDLMDDLSRRMEPLNSRLDRIEQALALIQQSLETLMEAQEGPPGPIDMGLDTNAAAIEEIRLRLERVDRSIGSFPEVTSTSVCSELSTLHGLAGVTPRRTADIVCSEIVGESYYRWDSSVHYFPTLVLIFKDPLSESPVRRSQAKFRVTGYNIPLTTADIENLQARCEQLLGEALLTYVTGLVRCNYVSPHSSGWKTTIFASSVQEAESVLIAGCALAGEVFVRERLSYTQGRHPRANLEAGSPASYDRRMEIKKAALLVNGSSSGPIVLYRRD